MIRNEKISHKNWIEFEKQFEDSHIVVPIPGSSYSHKNIRKFIYYFLNSDPAEELPALSEILIFFFHTQ
jgi:hypothetical protein